MGPRAEDSGYISDESDFYGSSETKTRYESQVRSFSVQKWWEETLKHPTPRLKARLENRNMSSLPPPYNPYQGCPLGWQLQQPIEDFLEELRPSKTSAELGPWIYIANPWLGREYWEASADTDEDSIRIDGDHAIWSTPSGGRGYAQRIEDTIVRIATQYNSKSGKWMLFPSTDVVDFVWSIVARATHAGALGTSAKIATNDYSGKSPVLCIYTKDFTDYDDVVRVIKKMKELGVVDEYMKIYYKPDIYTTLGIYSGNKHKIRPWLYCSKDIIGHVAR